jgi:hypothetical protein
VFSLQICSYHGQLIANFCLLAADLVLLDYTFSFVSISMARQVIRVVKRSDDGQCVLSVSVTCLELRIDRIGATFAFWYYLISLFFLIWKLRERGVSPVLSFVCFVHVYVVVLYG